MMPQWDFYSLLLRTWIEKKFQLPNIVNFLVTDIKVSLDEMPCGTVHQSPLLPQLLKGKLSNGFWGSIDEQSNPNNTNHLLSSVKSIKDYMSVVCSCLPTERGIILTLYSPSFLHLWPNKPDNALILKSGESHGISFHVSWALTNSTCISHYSLSSFWIITIMGGELESIFIGWKMALIQLFSEHMYKRLHWEAIDEMVLTWGKFISLISPSFLRPGASLWRAYRPSWRLFPFPFPLHLFPCN